MADPLSLLRQYNVSKKDIIEHENHIIFGKISWAKDANTNYLKWGAGKKGSIKEYYTLECLIFFIRNTNLSHPVYVKRAAAANIPAVRRPDRKELLTYLNGETTICESIDKSAPLEIPVRAANIPAVRRPDRKELLTYLNGETTICESIDKSAPLEIPVRVKRTCDHEGKSLAKKPRIEDTHVQKLREHLAARLDAPKETSVTVDNIKSLSEAMSVEKIAAIKSKILAKKRTTIKNHDYTDGIGVVGSELKAFWDRDVNNITSRERQWRTRTTILQSSGKIFSTSIMAMLHGLRESEEVKSAVPKSPVVAPPPAAVPSQQAQYNRYGQERFITEKDTGVFKINTMETYQGVSLKSMAEGPDASVAFAKVSRRLPIILQRTPKIPMCKRASQMPIIIIPATNSLITMFNVKDILQDQKFVPAEQKKAEGVIRKNEVIIVRTKTPWVPSDASSGIITVPYRVVDNPGRLQGPDWDRVVAVFVQGPAWQFKGWPWGGNPVQIFANICAFHMKFDETKLDDNVARWAVCVLNLSPTKRHLDRAVLLAFWDTLDKHMMKNKPHLM